MSTSTVRKALEAKKALILSNAQKQAAEIDHDMADLERLTAKYGLAVTDATTQTVTIPTITVKGNGAVAENKQNAVETILTAVHETLKSIADASITARARAGAEAYIRAKNRPAMLNEIYEVLQREGITFQSDTPKNTLSAVLGQTPTLESLGREKGWWLKGVPEPDLLHRRI